MPRQGRTNAGGMRTKELMGNPEWYAAWLTKLREGQARSGPTRRYPRPLKRGKSKR